MSCISPNPLPEFSTVRYSRKCSIPSAGQVQICPVPRRLSAHYVPDTTPSTARKLMPKAHPYPSSSQHG